MAFDLFTDGRPPATVVISAINGTAGVGKTTLAVRWAHQVAERFPDGQLYVNLRGFGPTSSVAEPADALRGSWTRWASRRTGSRPDWTAGPRCTAASSPVHHADGDHDAARRAWQQALAIYQDLDHPQATRIRALLHRDPTHST